ncbi:glycosyltransferase [Paraliobacillus sediminis]|uniref:glycosyltransferase n=1 Tax=Paraliobacillus sediminis TaxID=1885916 RepID=UPI0013C365A1|nr:glycosyltransferase [Paraliobacillus sediminis]
MINDHRIKVMFLNHTATIGGGERSLLDILTFINKDKFQVSLVCFEEGPLVEKVKKIKNIDVTVVPFPNKILKYNRDKRSILQLFSFFYIVIPVIKLLGFTLRSKPNVLYTNSMKAHFIGVIIGKLSFNKVIWHVRDILDEGLNKRVFIWLSQFTNEIICISKAVSKQFEQNEKIKVVYNGILPLEEVSISEGI